ncbi:MAG TPA: hypothetical protein PLC61_06910 [Chitinophagales bacterium]|nr:hypothetical protein [Chitinophagales bacterium]HMU97957.1 hypothetical protein [Chitinophagales bacterium]HMV02913.1 hypothetical protein [Chitinophagales bacterium]HMW93521.1 hypothetical protein [Chitinophagales bacterium]HMZ68303.1 hypothetical protein [Chitinophagales bacterium]
MKINYIVSFDESNTHYATINLTISNIQEDYLELKMPVWIPGSYLVREFAKNIDFILDIDTQKRLKKKNKNTWFLEVQDRKTIHLQYKLYCFEWSVRTNHINREHAFLNGAATFLYIEKYQQLPIEIQFIPSSGWKEISTNLESINEDFWHRIASNFDELYDSVFEIGNQKIYYFDVQQTAYTLAIYGEHDAEISKVISDLQAIIEQQIMIFGQHPCRQYLFIIHHSENAFGGLEHCHSSVNHIPRNYFHNQVKYQQAISLLAHEHFHLWNVKRIKPSEFIPFDYEHENYTEMLWFFEGITSYYDDLTCYRAGVFSNLIYLKVIEDLLDIVENNAGNDCQTLAESSFDTWIKYYRPNENTGNTQVSYYRKGALVVMLMDIIIQYYSGGKFSLDNLMHSAFKDTLVSNYSGITKPYIIEKLEQICLYDWNTFYENCIESTQPLAISEIFKLSNYQLSISDKNSKTIGVKLKKVGEQFAISSMDKNYFKFNGQLQVDDIVLKIDNQELINNFDEIIEQKAIGKILNFYIRRDGIDKEVEVMLTRSIDKRFTVSPK